MILCCAESSPFTFIQTIANQENITNGNLIDIISERFSGIDYRRKSETKLRGVIVRNVGNIDKFSNKLRLTRKTIMAGITLRQLIRGHQKGGKFRKQVTKKIALELLRTKCNENFMYSVSSTSKFVKIR